MTNEERGLLFKGIQSGNKADFQVIFNYYFPRLMRYATQFLDRAEAEDVVQDVFTDIWAKRNLLDFGDSIVSLLYRLVHNKSLNLIKHQQIIEGYRTQFEITQKKLDYFSPDQNEIFQRIFAEERFSTLTEAINLLPEKGKKCLQLSYIDGMKSKDIADLMGISIRTVETHIYKSLQSLRKSFNNADITIYFILLSLAGQ